MNTLRTLTSNSLTRSLLGWHPRPGRVAAGLCAAVIGINGLVGVPPVHADHHAGDHAHQEEKPVAVRDLVDTAVTAGQFNKLVNAVIAADLVGALKGDGPITIFAPTDAAFDKLGEGVYESLLQPENREKLVAVLTYHGVAGRVLAGDLEDDARYETLNGAEIRIDLDAPGGPRVNDSRIVATDVIASNGVIHVIDSVLLPPSSDAKPKGQAAAAALIESAIERGVPLFNRGDADACLAVYEVAVMGLLTADDATVPVEVKSLLVRAVDMADRRRGDEDKAWALRRGLDAALVTLNRSANRMMRTSTGPVDLGGGRVRFVLRGFAEANRVVVTGAFADWNENRPVMERVGDAWQLELDLGAGKHPYKFIVDGEWTLDPGNSRREMDHAGYENSVIVLGG
ncbi:fasciclin domain-containing protein [Mucisphaera sp.]|uniref:fasciclin domain-containing protein n=1 Tax=Mucisphaera sp. TaxID=2913024 RepID=UPI003D0D1DC5